MANNVDEILEEAIRRVGWFAMHGDATEAAELRNVLEDLKTAIAEERKIPPRNTAKLVEEIQAINASLDQPDAIPLIRGHVYAALSSRPRVCDVNSLEALSDFVVKIFRGRELCKDMPAPLKAMIEAGIRTALAIAYAYEPVKEKQG